MKRVFYLLMIVLVNFLQLSVYAEEGRLSLSGNNAAADDNFAAYKLNSGFREIVVVNKTAREKGISEGLVFSYPHTGSAATYYKIIPNTTNADASKVLLTWFEGYGASNPIKVYRFKDMPAGTDALDLAETALVWRNLDSESAAVCYMNIFTVTALQADITAATQLIAVGNQISLGVDGLEWSQTSNDTTSAYYVDVGAVQGYFNIKTRSESKP